MERKETVCEEDGRLNVVENVEGEAGKVSTREISVVCEMGSTEWSGKRM